MKEALGKAVLDTGCSKTCAGEVWYIEFFATLSPQDQAEVTEARSSSVFRFGDGKEVRSMKVVTVTIYVGKLKLKLDIDIVSFEIPLLLSKGAMKQMGMKLDLEKDIVTLNGEDIKLFCTSTGNYCLPISRSHTDLQNVNFVFHLENFDSLSDAQVKSKALKLHRQFSHPTKDKLIKKLK